MFKKLSCVNLKFVLSLKKKFNQETVQVLLLSQHTVSLSLLMIKFGVNGKETSIKSKL